MDNMCEMPSNVLNDFVFRKGQYFKVTVLDNDGKVVSPGQLKKIFQDIVDSVGSMCVSVSVYLYVCASVSVCVCVCACTRNL